MYRIAKVSIQLIYRDTIQSPSLWVIWGDNIWGKEKDALNKNNSFEFQLWITMHLSMWSPKGGIPWGFLRKTCICKIHSDSIYMTVRKPCLRQVLVFLPVWLLGLYQKVMPVRISRYVCALRGGGGLLIDKCIIVK